MPEEKKVSDNQPSAPAPAGTEASSPAFPANEPATSIPTTTPASTSSPALPMAPPLVDVEQWDQEDAGDREETELVVEKEAVTEQDKFRLAKNILLGAAFIYGGVALVTVSVLPDKTEDVWNFSKVALNSLVAVVVGYYFGKK